MSSPVPRYTTPPAETSRWVGMRRRGRIFAEGFFFEVAFVFAFAFAFARVPAGVPDPSGEAGFDLRRLRRRFRGGGSSEPAGMSSPAMTCG